MTNCKLRMSLARLISQNIHGKSQAKIVNIDAKVYRFSFDISKIKAAILIALRIVDIQLRFDWRKKTSSFWQDNFC
jgi:hypothetical protein